MSPRRFRVTADEFAAMARREFDLLPPRLRERLSNLTIDVEDLPDPATVARFWEEDGVDVTHSLLGLYVGVPFPRQDFGVPQPCAIKLYKRNIESIVRTRRELVYQIRSTLIHELGHHLGLSEAELEAMEEGKVEG